MSTLKTTVTYIRSFLDDKKVASVTPSSRYCVKKLCDRLNYDEAKTVIEYGPGTGVFTSELLKRLDKEAHLYAFETNERFVHKLKELHFDNWTLFESSVELIKDRLPESVFGKADYVISGIPFSFMDEELKYKIFDATKQVLKPGGSFLAYQTPGHMEDPLMKTFGNVDKELCLRNIPPYYIYESVKTAV